MDPVFSISQSFIILLILITGGLNWSEISPQTEISLCIGKLSIRVSVNRNGIQIICDFWLNSIKNSNYFVIKQQRAIICSFFVQLIYLWVCEGLSKDVF